MTDLSILMEPFEDEPVKVCTKCVQVKPLDQFHKHPTGKQGVQGQCKQCQAEYNKKYYLRKKAEANRQALPE